MRLYQRKTACLSAAFLCGAAAAGYGALLPFYAVFCLFLALYFAAAFQKENSLPPWCVICFLAALLAASAYGSYVSVSQQAFCGTYESRLKDGGEYLLQGTVCQKQQDSDSCLYYLKKCRVQQNGSELLCDSVLAHLTTSDYSIGQILIIKGTIKKFSQPPNEGGYDEKKDYQSRGFAFRLYAPKASVVYGRPDAFREWIFRVREALKKSYEAAMPGEDAGVLAAMALGDKSQMDADRKRMYQNAGISHFYSISGLHISLLGVAFWHLLKRSGAPCTLSCVLAAAWILGYGELIGFGISASRAIGMFLLLIYAKCRGKSYDRPTALFLMAAVLAWQNPGILQNAGFLLSFGAVLGVMLQEAIKEGYAPESDKDRRGMCAKVKEAILVSACIQFVTIPVLCCFFYEFSVYAVLANLFILPCMGALLGMGLLGGAAGCFFPAVGKCLLYPCHLLLRFFDLVCGAVWRMPFAVWITGRPSILKLFLWYGLLLLFVFLLHRKKRPPFLALPFLLACLLLALPKPAFEIDALDVGQGDGICIFTGDKTTLFIDGGSTDVKAVGTYRIIPFLKCRGILRIDYWFVSHCDADHINGLLEVMGADYPVKRLVVSEYMPDDAAARSLMGLAARYKIPVLSMGEKDAIKGKNGSWSMQSLSQKTEAASADRNAASLVLLYDSPQCRAFFGGDIGKEQEAQLLMQGALQSVNIYKASHHGSDTSNGKEALLALKPDIAVISCGLKNSYGHPGKEAVRNLKEVGAEIFETRYAGQVKIINGQVRKRFDVNQSK